MQQLPDFGISEAQPTEESKHLVTGDGLNPPNLTLVYPQKPRISKVEQPNNQTEEEPERKHTEPMRWYIDNVKQATEGLADSNESPWNLLEVTKSPDIVKTSVEVIGDTHNPFQESEYKTERLVELAMLAWEIDR
ncbi:hypothetical protein FRC00_011986 [Tulasnella sp. 408]|nr:hypothetical protein FRC00_011986 [Tulasnella sp. 408]